MTFSLNIGILFAGDIKFAVYVRHVWYGKGGVAYAILQQGASSHLFNSQTINYMIR